MYHAMQEIMHYSTKIFATLALSSTKEIEYGWKKELRLGCLECHLGQFRVPGATGMVLQEAATVRDKGKIKEGIVGCVLMLITKLVSVYSVGLGAEERTG